MKSDRVFLLELLKLILILHLHIYWWAFLLQYFCQIVFDFSVYSMHVHDTLSNLWSRLYAFTIWPENLPIGRVTKRINCRTSWGRNLWRENILVYWSCLRFLPHNQILGCTHGHLRLRLLRKFGCKTPINAAFIYVWALLQQALHLVSNLKFLIRIVWKGWSSSTWRVWLY